MAKTKIAVLWGVLIAMMVACAGIYATLKAREMNPYIGGTSTRIESVQPLSRTTWSQSMTER